TTRTWTASREAFGRLVRSPARACPGLHRGGRQAPHPGGDRCSRGRAGDPLQTSSTRASIEHRSMNSEGLRSASDCMEALYEEQRRPKLVTISDGHFDVHDPELYGS